MHEVAEVGLVVVVRPQLAEVRLLVEGARLAGPRRLGGAGDRPPAALADGAQQGPRVGDDALVDVEAAEHLLVLGRQHGDPRVAAARDGGAAGELVRQRRVLVLGDRAQLLELGRHAVVGDAGGGEVRSRGRQAARQLVLAGIDDAAGDQAEQQGRDLRDVGVVLAGQQLVDGAAAVEAAQEVQLLGQQVELAGQLAGPARGHGRVALGHRLEGAAGSLVGPALLHRREDQRLERLLERHAGRRPGLAALLELEAALLPAEDLEQLDPDLLLEAVAEVALGEDAHLDQQLALLLAGAADRLERVVALLLRDEALVGEDLAEELGREVAAHQRRPAVDEEHHLLRLSRQQVEVAGAARPGDVAD